MYRRFLNKLLVLIVSVVVFLFFILFTQGGGALTVRALSLVVNDMTDYTLRTKGFSGTLANSFALARVEIYCGAPSPITLHSLHFGWSLMDVLRAKTLPQKLQNMSLAAERVEMGNHHVAVKTTQDESGLPTIRVTHEQGHLELSPRENLVFSGCFGLDERNEIVVLGELLEEASGAALFTVKLDVASDGKEAVTVSIHHEMGSDGSQQGQALVSGHIPTSMEAYFPPDQTLQAEWHGLIEWWTREGEPGLVGKLGFPGLYYANDRTGTEFRSSDCDITVERNQVSVALTGMTSAGGSIACEACYPLTNFVPGPGTVEVTLDRAALIDRKDSTVVVSGSLKVDHSETIVVSGTLTTDALEIMEPDLGYLPPPQLNIEDQKGAGGEKQKVQLDLALTIPDNWYVSARGADLQLGGDLQLTGTTEAPLITGAIHSLRSSISVLGQKFVITDCSIQCLGQDMQSHFIAETKKGNDRFYLEVQATNLDADIQLKSDPYYPEDELLAKLLFGKDISKITPLEAVSLTYSLEQLRNPSSAGWNPAQKLRRALGLHYLSIEMTDSNTVLLTTGTYIGDRLFLGIKKDLGYRDDQLYAEYQLSNRVKVEAAAKSAEPSRLSLSWAKEY